MIYLYIIYLLYTVFIDFPLFTIQSKFLVLIQPPWIRKLQPCASDRQIRVGTGKPPLKHKYWRSVNVKTDTETC